VESGDPFATPKKKGGWKLDPKPLSTVIVKREEGRERKEGRERNERKGKERRGDKEEKESLRETM
jgi:hypothetical protein